MATLIAWTRPNGQKGRCDGKCHSGRAEGCRCLCGGELHGKMHAVGGLEAAIREVGDRVLEHAARKAREEGLSLDTSKLRGLLLQGRQMSLLPDGRKRT